MTTGERKKKKIVDLIIDLFGDTKSVPLDELREHMEDIKEEINSRMDTITSD